MFLSSRLAATCYFVIDLVVLKFDLQILEILVTLVVDIRQILSEFSWISAVVSPHFIKFHRLI